MYGAVKENAGIYEYTLSCNEEAEILETKEEDTLIQWDYVLKGWAKGSGSQPNDGVLHNNPNNASENEEGEKSMIRAERLELARETLAIVDVRMRFGHRQHGNTLVILNCV